jgi:hypothetical protein
LNDAVGTVVVVLGAAAAALAPMPHRFSAPRDLPPPNDLIVVQVPASAVPRTGDRSSVSTPLDRYVDGARIVRVDRSSGRAIVLTPEFTAAADPDVSFDGKTIVFAGKRTAHAPWQIWTMRADGSHQAQLTRGPGPHVAPVYAGARFYLDDPQPTPQIIFAHSAPGVGSFALYGTDMQGVVVHRLTFTPQSDFSPAVLPTGQVVFSSWQRDEDGVAADSTMGLLTVNIDGTDFMPFYGNHAPPRYKDMPAVDPAGDRVYFIESEQRAWLGGGKLAYVSWRQPFHSDVRLSGDADDAGLFHSPAPLPDGGLLASYRQPDSAFAVYRIDPESGRRLDRVFAQPGWHSIDTHVLASRPPFKGKANWLKPGVTTGVFFCLNSYRTTPGEGVDGSGAPPGTIRHVRVIEGPAPRILGVVPVEPDGSFHIKVPAETPITFQLLDEDYVALRSQQTWTWVMGNESRGCIGCHEDPRQSPPNRLVMAIRKPAVDLLLPPGRRRTVDYRHQVAPILASRCATSGCHAPDQAAPPLGQPGAALSDSALHAVYASLVRRPQTGHGGAYVVPGSAKDSPLIRLLLGRATNTPPHGTPPHNVLDRRDLIVLIEWVDLGAQWEFPPSGAGKEP